VADPIHQFVITPLIPLEVAGVNLSFTNSSLWMALGAIIATSFFLVGTGKKAMIPGRMQALSEIVYEFVASMIRENTGSEGRRYFPFIFTLFTIVLMGNVLGLLPYAFTYTSHIIVTAALAVTVFLAVTIFGFMNHGLKFLSLFSPPGIPFALKFLIIPIELLSFMIRPVTLSVRLFANMMAGHLMLKVFAGFSTMMIAGGAVGFIGSLVPMVFNVALMALEFLVALLQAYIFAILSAIYLKDTVDLQH
jgi:F-type H+-transporting ATPase subunit a